MANPEKVVDGRLLRHAVRLVNQAGRQALADGPTARAAGLPLEERSDLCGLARDTDLLLVFGGDGTILRVARQTAGCRKPILGVNLGSLGFLTASPDRAMPAALRALWAGKCLVEPRALLEVSGHRAAPPRKELALNDFVISHGAVPRLIELEVRVDGGLLTRYRGDGLIVSSPTGSTAYSLAAGGAVVSPEAEVIALTPICPHTLSSRSVILSLDAAIEVRLLTERVEAFLAADGQVSTRLAAGSALMFCRSPHHVRLVRLPGSSFFETLRQKLNWSGSSVGTPPS